jgi:hypothetical protein
VDGDTTDEPNERFYVQLGSAVNATAPTYTRITLLDDDSPMTPELFALSPASGPSRDVVLKGVAQTGSQVAIYTQLGCAGGVLMHVSAAALAAGVPVIAADNASSYWSAKALNATQEESSCSGSATYTHDDLAPTTPGGLGFASGSPANDNTPDLVGTTDKNVRVRVFSDQCVSSPIATSDADGAGAIAMVLPPVENDSTTTYWADAVDAAGNRSTCTTISYVEDSTAPGLIGGLTFVNAASGIGTQPLVIGTAEPGTSVDVYAVDGFGECTGPVLATVTADQLAGGARIPFDQGTTSSRALVDRDAAGNALTCTSFIGLTYTEQSTETEPNGSTVDADSGSSGLGTFHQYGELGTSADFDYYAVNVPAGTVITLETLEVPFGSTCASNLLDTRIDLLDGAGTQLGFDDDLGPGFCSKLSRVLTGAGNYFVRVRPSASAAPNLPYPLPYDLKITTQVAPATSTAAEVESNGTSGTANALGSVSTSQWRDVTGAVTPQGDLDWFSFTLASTTTVVLETVDGATSNCLSNHEDTHLTVYASDGTTVLGTNDDSGDGFCSKLTMTNLAAGTYFVQLKASPLASPGDTTFDYKLGVHTPLP